MSNNAMNEELFPFELVSSLSFTENKGLWDSGSNDYQKLARIKAGSEVIDVADPGISAAIVKFFTGLLMFSFTIYENIGKKYINIIKKQDDIVNIMFSDGDNYTLDVNKYDGNMTGFFKKSLNLLLGQDKQINADTFSALSRMFDAAAGRMAREVKFLKGVGGIADPGKKLFNKGKININLFSVIMAAIPQNFLNSFFMLAANQMKSDFEVLTTNGATINAKAFFAGNTLDVQELFNKIKVLIIIYQNDEKLFTDLLEDKEILDYLDLVLRDDGAQQKIKENINETIEGQYLPRLETIKAFQKVLG